MVCITSGTLEKIFVHQFLEYFSKQFLDKVSAVYSKNLNTAAVTSRGDANETSLQTGLWCLLKSESLNSTLHNHVTHILNHLEATMDFKPKETSVLGNSLIIGKSLLMISLHYMFLFRCDIKIETHFILFIPKVLLEKKRKKTKTVPH
jgi:hypothetical protein